jgi:chromosome segregation ATPase
MTVRGLLARLRDRFGRAFDNLAGRDVLLSRIEAQEDTLLKVRAALPDDYRNRLEPLAGLVRLLVANHEVCQDALAMANQRTATVTIYVRPDLAKHERALADARHVANQCEQDRQALADERDEARAEVAALRRRVAEMAADERGHRLVCERAQTLAGKLRDRLAAVAEAAAAPID